MSEDFDKAIDEIQASIIADARKIYSEKVIQSWLNPKYMGEMESPQGQGKVTGTCGDLLLMDVPPLLLQAVWHASWPLGKPLRRHLRLQRR
jgi:hypothetical protein